MKTDEELRQNIMRRVWMVHTARLASHPALHFGGFVAVLLFLSSMVSFKNVALNTLLAAGNPASLLYFLTDAVATTETTVQAFSLIALFLLVVMARDIMHQTALPA